MKEKITRNDFFKKSAMITAGVTAGVMGVGMLNSKKADAEGFSRTTWPWPYATLDPEAVRILGHDNFWAGYACSAGAFDAIITALQGTSVGSTYAEFPTKMMIFGHGGGVGWGTLCGTLIGCGAAIALVCEKADSDILINELYGWYTQAQFPTTISNTYATTHQFGNTTHDMTLDQNACGSPLCHISVTEWCNVANFGVGSNERKERCARVAGDVAAKAAELLNAHFAGTFVAAYVPPATIASCTACHGGGGIVDNVAVKQDCVQCHGTDPHSVSVAEFDNSQDNFGIKQNFPNPFGAETTMEFSLAKPSKVTIDVYNLNGQHIKTIVNDELYNMGSHSVDWDGNDVMGQKAKSGMYVYRMRVGHKTLTKSMMKI